MEDYKRLIQILDLNDDNSDILKVGVMSVHNLNLINELYKQIHLTFIRVDDLCSTDKFKRDRGRKSLRNFGQNNLLEYIDNTPNGCNIIKNLLGEQWEIFRDIREQIKVKKNKSTKKKLRKSIKSRTKRKSRRDLKT